MLEVRVEGISQQAHAPGVVTFSAGLTGFMAWSPDGRFLLADATIARWRVNGPGQAALGPDALRDFGRDQAPLLPLRDAAMAHLITTFPHDQSGQPVTAQIPVAWSPNGRLLVTPESQNSVALYDCATGQQIATLTADQTPASSPTGPILRWSPDSRHLLSFDGQLGSLTIWGPGEVPAR